MHNQHPYTSIDRIAEGSLRLLLALSWLLLASFVAVTVSATRARAEEADCRGRDMIAAMAKSNPSKLDALRSESAATENGQGILWRIEKPNIGPSYLFGTMHLTDARVLTLPVSAEAAYNAADTIVIETDEVLDPKALLKVMAETPDLMMLANGATLESMIPGDKLPLVKQELSERGLSLAAVNRMQPWILTSMLALPVCEMARKEGGTDFLDIKLAKEAIAQGKDVKGLETIKDQLGAMASLPLKFHIDGLVETLTLAPELPDLFETMTVLYTRGDIGMIFPFMRAVSPPDSDGDYAAFEERMINVRNHTMATRAIPILERGNAFIAVGALHLPGEQGLVHLLRQKGYTITVVATN